MITGEWIEEWEFDWHDKLYVGNYYSALASALNAEFIAPLEEKLREREWQPIKSAPQIGEILLWWRSCKCPRIGKWIEDETGEGWKCEGDALIPRNQKDCTHWMPLPKGPEALEGGSQS